jgi:hemerythrin-like domain-containing protein
MEAIENLMAEHQLILGAIGALEGFAGEVRRGGDDAAELGRFVTFIREFADAHHHAKEEDLLFTAMVEAGFPRDGGPIAVMLHEHDQGRAQVRVLAEVAAAPTPWSAADRERLHGAALGYADLLRAHIHKEDAILYPLAEARLPAALAARVDAGAAAHDARQVAAGVLPRLETLGTGLMARHGGASSAA